MRKHRKLVKTMKARGWSAELTNKNHIRFVHDDTQKCIIHAGTASDHRAQKNMLARAKRIEEGRDDTTE